MQQTAHWPQVDAFRDHWTWRPEWTASRPRLLWYLSVKDSPEVRAAARPGAKLLRDAGADVVPPEWLHLTVTDVGFPDEVDPGALRAARARVRDAVRHEPHLELTLGPVDVLPGAVVLAASPRERLARLRSAVRAATAGAGISPPHDIDGEYCPHVSLCYVNAGTDHERLRDAVAAAEPVTVQAVCRRLVQVLVTRRDGHYRWEVVDEVPLGTGVSAGRT